MGWWSVSLGFSGWAQVCVSPALQSDSAPSAHRSEGRKKQRGLRGGQEGLALSEMAQSWVFTGVLDGSFSNTRGSESSFLTKDEHIEGRSMKLTRSRP